MDLVAYSLGAGEGDALRERDGRGDAGTAGVAGEGAGEREKVRGGVDVSFGVRGGETGLWVETAAGESGEDGDESANAASADEGDAGLEVALPASAGTKLS